MPLAPLPRLSLLPVKTSLSSGPSGVPEKPIPAALARAVCTPRLPPTLPLPSLPPPQPHWPPCWSWDIRDRLPPPEHSPTALMAPHQGFLISTRPATPYPTFLGFFLNALNTHLIFYMFTRRVSFPTKLRQLYKGEICVQTPE